MALQSINCVGKAERECKMTDLEKQKLGKTLWNIADQLRGAMNADDFRDYMLSFLFLRYLSDNYELAAQRSYMHRLFAVQKEMLA